MLEINNDAIFIADSHTQNGRDALLFILDKITKNATPSQIFLLGDIANILVGNLKSSLKANENLLKTLESLSQKTQIFYFEGNHDFNLNAILPRIATIPRKNQPIIAKYNDKRILLAHGDIFLNKSYEIYIKILTANITGKVLKMLDFVTFGRLYRFIESKVQNKRIKIAENHAIHEIVKHRIAKYQSHINKLNMCVDMVIEGHFHLGEIITPDNARFFAFDSANSAGNGRKTISDSAILDSDMCEKVVEKCKFFYIAMPSFYHAGSLFRIKECEFVKI